MAAEIKIASLPGDGIGTECLNAAADMLAVVSQRIPTAALHFEHQDAGATYYEASGESLPDKTIQACEQADAILLGAMGMPDIRYKDGTEISPQLDIRDHFQLYAGVRPVRLLPGVPSVLSDPRSRSIDMLLIREQTEGLFFDRGKTLIENGVAYDRMAISEKGAGRISEYAFNAARRRGAKPGASKAQLTLVDKANVLGSMAFFRDVFLKIGEGHSDVDTDCAYVDATALNLIRKPWEMDVLVTENQFGDILSDLCAALIGGMGMAPSADIGDKHAMFQPAHGSAPDIAGQGIANPVATLLSVAMMYDWLGDKHNDKALVQAGELIHQSVDAAFADGQLLPTEFGGSANTAAIVSAVNAQVGKLPLPDLG